jgi:hypothetical protein
LSQEEVIASRASALQLVVASWLVLDVGKSGFFFNNGIDGACGLRATAEPAAAQLAPAYLDQRFHWTVKEPSHRWNG